MNKYAKSHPYVAKTTFPDVFITMKKNRLRVYGGREIYLNSGDEFELEFDNTSQTTWLAKIKLNGEWISQAGLVLRPGEHIYLDTPNLDSSEKCRFRFETYEVEKGRSHIIENNGLVEIFFHKKTQPFDHWITYTSQWVQDNNWKFQDDWYSYSTDGGTFRDNISVNYCNSDQNSIGKHSPEMEETGRIGEGSHSNQDFFNSNESFESFHSHSVTYKILPQSKRPTTIREVKEYCSNCGRRRRKNENFCPSCGSKF